MKNLFRIIALLMVLTLAACTASEDKAPEAQLSETAAGNIDSAQTEGSFSSPNYKQEETLPGGSDSSYDAHPAAVEAKKIEREIYIPDGVKGKWKAVKLLIRDKSDEEKNEIKVVDLGSSFVLGDSGMKVTIGSFFPNFVMDQTRYTSLNNELINPAVQITVEENGKNIYKGWAFENHPTLYAFENEKYGVQLMGSIATDVS